MRKSTNHIRPRKPKGPKYTVKEINAVRHAEQIAEMINEEFGNRATAFIGTTWVGAFSGEGELVAVAGCMPSVIEPGGWYLNRSYVKPAHRGYGLQRLLIKARLGVAKANGASHATSDTWNNPHSANNLIACGFRAYQPDDPWRAEGCCYWKVKL